MKSTSCSERFESHNMALWIFITLSRYWKIMDISSISGLLIC